MYIFNAVGEKCSINHQQTSFKSKQLSMIAGSLYLRSKWRLYQKIQCKAVNKI